MLALTLQHPHAFAVAFLGKDVENRTWKPGTRLCKNDGPRSWFAIHGGKAPVGVALSEVLAHAEELAEYHCPDQIFPPFDADFVVREGVVAICRFGGVVTKSDSPWFHGPFGWVLEQVYALPEPVPCKGSQGLWQLPDPVYWAVREQYGEALRTEREQMEMYPA